MGSFSTRNPHDTAHPAGTPVVFRRARRGVAHLAAARRAARGALLCRLGVLSVRPDQAARLDITLALFADEYHVPLLSPNVAAWLGTGAELILPVLLVFGLFGRFAALGLSLLNVVAVLSLMDIPDAALMGHVFWGSLLLALLLWGPGRWSVDRFMVPWLRAHVFGHRASPAAPRAVAGGVVRR
jgi:putative oxidoreductase